MPIFNNLKNYTLFRIIITKSCNFAYISTIKGIILNSNLIYSLYCPINNVPVYVGKSSVGTIRPFEHIKEKSHSKKVNEWVANLKKCGVQPILLILESDFKEEYMDSKEQYWIHRMLNDGHILLNQINVSPVFFAVKEFDREIEQDFLSEVRMFIKAQRKTHKLTQQELAAKAGVGLRFLRELEQGAKSNFNTESIHKILKLFGNFKLTLERV